jgi:hypothetical protein
MNQDRNNLSFQRGIPLSYHNFMKCRPSTLDPVPQPGQPRNFVTMLCSERCRIRLEQAWHGGQGAGHSYQVPGSMGSTKCGPRNVVHTYGRFLHCRNVIVPRMKNMASFHVPSCLGPGAGALPSFPLQWYGSADGRQDPSTPASPVAELGLGWGDGIGGEEVVKVRQGRRGGRKQK